MAGKSKKPKRITYSSQLTRLEKLADDIVNSASQYAVIKELHGLKEPLDEDDKIYKNFLMAILMTFDDTTGYEH
jgi:hypothetical protein